MATSKPKAQYAKPASQVDLEERQEKGNASDRVLTTADSYEASADEGGRDFRVEGNETDGYVGVSPEYQTYANDTEAPLESDEDSAEQKVFDHYIDNYDTSPVIPSSTSYRQAEGDEEDDEPSGSDSTSDSTAGSTS